jgi:homogentisate 1,2-dioxygenase
MASSPDQKKRKLQHNAHTEKSDTVKKEDPYAPYNVGFGNAFESEAIKGAVPRGMNNPKVCPFGLYAEQLSGTSFTTPNAKNKKVWFYRIRPSVVHEPYKPINQDWTKNYVSDFTKDDLVVTPQQLRWKPLPFPDSDQKVNFVQGIVTVGGSGSPETKVGFSVHLYVCNSPMGDTAFNNADADMLIVPQKGDLHIRTEHGRMLVPPGHICVIQRGIKFSVDVTEESRGYISEIFKGHFVIPDRGPIGANGLANERDFEVPSAWYDDGAKQNFTIIHKFCGKFFSTSQKHSCFDVVGWHGNYVPYRVSTLSLFPV